MKKIMESFLQGGTIGLGLLFVVILGGVTYAAWNDVVSTGDSLTPARWNDLVSQVESISFPVGMVAPFGGNSCPTGWVAANGALLPLSSYPTLAGLLGTTYGGNGLTNYALPDLRGRTAVGVGTGPGLSAYILGQRAGQESAVLSPSNLPSHNHLGILSNNLIATSVDAGGSDLASLVRSNSTSAGSQTVTVANTGGSQGFNIRQPYITLTYCIYTGN